MTDKNFFPAVFFHSFDKEAKPLVSEDNINEGRLRLTAASCVLL